MQKDEVIEVAVTVSRDNEVVAQAFHVADMHPDLRIGNTDEHVNAIKFL